MKGFDFLKISPAGSNHNKFDLVCSHQTTLDFGQIIPIHVQEVLIGDKFHVTSSIFSRLAPMAVPTYGDVKLKTLSVFVPCRILANDFEAWYSGNQYDHGQPVFLRQFTYTTFHNLFVSRIGSITLMESVDTVQQANYVYRGSDNLEHYKRFTPLGRYVYKIFRCLGYSFINEYTEGQTEPLYFNAMRLLAYIKGYYDLMSNSISYSRNELGQCLEAIYSTMENNDYITYSSGKALVTLDSLSVFVRSISLMYDSDYFTSAWRYPDSPLYDNTIVGSPSSPLSLDKLTSIYKSDDSKGRYFKNEPYIYTATGGNGGELTSRAIDYIQRFDAFLRRNNYSGSRAVQRVLSRFGIKPEEYRSRYSLKVGSSVSQVQIGDVTNTTATDSSDPSMQLGSYAGKAISSDSNTFDFHASDFGYIITYAYLSVKPVYYQGIDRDCLRAVPSDYYQPEYDGIGAQSIPFVEFFAHDCIHSSVSGEVRSPLNTYGYTERYNEYRFGKSRVTGDFTYFNDMDSWHLGRDLSDEHNLLAQDSRVVSYPMLGSEYDRIFAVNDSSVDHFYINALFDVTASRNVKTTSQATNLGDGDLSINRNGNEIT